MPITVIDNDSVTMQYHPETAILEHRIHKPIWGDAFRDALNQGLEVLQRHGGKKWLSDNRANSALSKEDTEWALNDWFPRSQKTEWKYWAIVLPAHVMGQMNMKRIIADYAAQGMVTRIFAEPDAAMTWLQNPT